MDTMQEFGRAGTGSTDVNTRYPVTPVHLCLNMKLTHKQRNEFIIEYFFLHTC